MTYSVLVWISFFFFRATIDGSGLSEQIQNVRALFPQLGEGFLAECLPYFDNDPEKLINALLEDNLPPHLSSLDRTMPLKPLEPIQSTNEIVDPVEEQSNNFEGMDLTKIHRGKKKVAKNANALLEDKKELAGLKEKFSALGIGKIAELPKFAYINAIKIFLQFMTKYLYL